MGWGADISSAYQAASTAAKAAAQSAAQTAQTAWEYTKQKAAEAQQAMAQTATATEAAADDAQRWAGEKVDQGVDLAERGWSGTKQVAGETRDAVGESFRRIGTAFNRQPAGSALSGCPLQNPPALPPPGRGDGSCKPPPPCVVKPLHVKCGHGKRAFVLLPPNTPTNEAHDQLIQVIADDNGHDEIEVFFASGSCPHGNGPNRPCLYFADQQATSTLKLKLPGPPSPILPMQSTSLAGATIPFVEFVRHFIIRKDPGYTSFSGNIDCCQGLGANQSFHVEVFPKREWTGKIQAGIEIEATNPLDEDYARRKVYAMKRAELVFKGELTGAYGDREIKCTTPSFKIARGSAKHNIVGADEGFAVTKRWLDAIYPAVAKFKHSPLVKIEPEWPNLTFAGTAKAVEVRQRYDVAWQGEAALKLDPLFGVKGTFDALQWLIDFACHAYLPPGVSTLASAQILKIRRMAERGVGGGAVGSKFFARIDISARGAFGGELKWELRPGLNDVASGSLLGDIDITVEGKVSGEVRVLRVSYQAGATISGASGLSGKLTAAFYNGDLAFGGVAKLKEFKIKAIAFQSLGGSSVGQEKEGQAKGAQRRTAKKKAEKDGKWFGLFDQDNDSARAEDNATWEMEIWPEAILLGGGLEKDLYGEDFKGNGGSFGGGGASGGHGATSSWTPLTEGV